MAIGTRAAVPIVVLITSLLLSACGGESDNGMRATLTDDDCTYEGDTTTSAGMFTVEVANQTEYFGAFALASIADGSTIKGDLEPFVEKARQQFDESGTLPGLPPYYEQVVRGAAQPGETTYLPADVPPGTYALMCFVDDLPTWRAYVAAQFDVTK